MDAEITVERRFQDTLDLAVAGATLALATSLASGNA